MTSQAVVEALFRHSSALAEWSNYAYGLKNCQIHSYKRANFLSVRFRSNDCQTPYIARAIVAVLVATQRCSTVGFVPDVGRAVSGVVTITRDTVVASGQRRHPVGGIVRVRRRLVVRVLGRQQTIGVVVSVAPASRHAAYRHARASVSIVVAIARRGVGLQQAGETVGVIERVAARAGHIGHARLPPRHIVGVGDARACRIGDGDELTGGVIGIGI